MVFSFSAVTIILLVLQIIGLDRNYQHLIGVSAFVGLILTGASLIFGLICKEDLSLLMCQQKNTAEKYKMLRDSYMSLIEEIMSNTTDESILKERTLAYDDILHYQKIIVALSETDRLMKEIDEIGIEEE